MAEPRHTPQGPSRASNLIPSGIPNPAHSIAHTQANLYRIFLDPRLFRTFPSPQPLSYIPRLIASIAHSRARRLDRTLPGPTPFLHIHTLVPSSHVPKHAAHTAHSQAHRLYRTFPTPPTRSHIPRPTAPLRRGGREGGFDKRDTTAIWQGGARR